MELTPGRTLGPYQIVEKVGAGGMGSVYRARDPRLDRSVAIKVLPEGLSDDPRLRERLAQEARAISALSHPNICALYDIGNQHGIDYLVMEFIEGETLADRLTRSGTIPLRQALAWGADIAAALDAAHRAGIIHRDLKPGNIMIARSGARLLDFGLARQAATGMEEDRSLDHPTERMPLTDPGTVVGTLLYMSPEQTEGRPLDARSDIFSFGAVLYEMLSGKRQWPGRALQIGQCLIAVDSLRGRCVMTTFDPDTGEQDPAVLKEIVRDLGGRLALNCDVIRSGSIAVGDAVALIDEEQARDLVLQTEPA